MPSAIAGLVQFSGLGVGDDICFCDDNLRGGLLSPRQAFRIRVFSGRPRFAMVASAGSIIITYALYKHFAGKINSDSRKNEK